MALAKDRKLDFLTGAVASEFAYPVAAGFRIFRGSIAAVCADMTLVPAGSANTPAAQVHIAGIAKHYQDNTGSALPVAIGEVITGPGRVLCHRGCFALPFDAAPTGANIGAPVYAVDDQTVSLTQTVGSVTRLQVGTLAGFDQNATPYVQV